MGIESIRRREIVTKYGERLTMHDGSIWLHPFNGAKPVQERQSCLTQGHAWEPDGTFTGGCVGLVCEHCGATDEKDVS